MALPDRFAFLEDVYPGLAELLENVACFGVFHGHLPLFETGEECVPAKAMFSRLFL